VRAVRCFVTSVWRVDCLTTLLPTCQLCDSCWQSLENVDPSASHFLLFLWQIKAVSFETGLVLLDVTIGLPKILQPGAALKESTQLSVIGHENLIICLFYVRINCIFQHRPYERQFFRWSALPKTPAVLIVPKMVVLMQTTPVITAAKWLGLEGLVSFIVVRNFGSDEMHFISEKKCALAICRPSG